ncbi:AN1-type zinc finger domain-containing protein [Salinirubrum litoreum]|uniref:AN1-type zinc finger domain-containing protein n=1 Tax=Salinirubrum litoreum TaxID=1126234 RepID=A0ABD5REC4_9EURY|nr:AN1-type zinc finger protein [Salinirubrum litoreum]
MPECDQCDETDISQSCTYCEGTFCAEHRLPENHDCLELKNRQVSAEIGAGASEGAVLGEIETGDEQDEMDLSRPKPEVTTSPDTNLDGSLGESEEPAEIDRDQPDKPGLFQRLKVIAEVQSNRGSAVARTLLRVLGIVMVLIGAYNLLLFGFLARESGVLGFYYAVLPPFFGDIVFMAIGASITWFL